VRYLSNSGFGSKPVPGNNYRMPGAVMVTFQQTEDPRTGEKITHYRDAAKNPPDGAIVWYVLKDKPAEDITLTFLGADGTEIRTFSSHEPADEAERKKQKDPRIPKEEGLNRFVWNLRYPDAARVEDDEAANELVEEGINGPVVAPGTYRVRLKVGDQQLEESFEVQRDPRVSASDADLQAQFDLLLRIRDKLSETHTAVNQIRALRRRAEDVQARAKDKPELEGVSSAAKAVIDALAPIEAELIQVKAKSRADTLNFPVRLNGKLAALAGVVNSADGPPIQSAVAVFGELCQRVEAQRAALQRVVETQVEALNQAIRAASLAPVGV
jgi:hypothetical protein